MLILQSRFYGINADETEPTSGGEAYLTHRGRDNTDDDFGLNRFGAALDRARPAPWAGAIRANPARVNMIREP